MRTRGLLPVALLTVILIYSFAAGAADPIQFSPADSYGISTSAYRMTSGDFNKDGYADLAVAQDNTSYSILMNNGSGGFTAASYTITGSRLKDAVVVQLAGDTIPDLVLSDRTGANIRVLTGVGNGTFNPPVSVSVGGAEGLAAGDFNGDGYPDVAVCLFTTSKVAVLLGTSGGSFGPATTYNTGVCDDLAVGLVNSDGYQDIVTANWNSDSISVLLGNGDGTFATATNIPCGNDNTDVTLADINHDSLLDAVVSSYANKTAVIMLGNGAGGFTQSQALSVVTGPQQVRVADFNFDGFLDIVTANASAAPGMALLQATGYNTFMAAATFHSDQKANGLAIADFNHDGGPDVATSHPTNSTVRVLKVIPTLDTDGDGMPDWWESQYACVNPLVGDSTLDADSDGLRNLQEFTHLADPCLADTDGDGLNDGAEVNTYLTDPSKADTDSDGMPDGYEVLHVCLTPTVNDAGADPDGDLWTNLYEYQQASDPCVAADIDSDGMPDAWEAQYASCGLDPNINDAGLDPDADTKTNLQEYQALTNPCVVNDADGDGMPDHYEVLHACLNSAVNDASADPDGDLWTNLYEYQHATDPCVFTDTDSDGMPDAWEIQYASCGLDPNVNDADLDPDADTKTNLQEYLAHTNPCVVNDADGDGMPDHYEVLHACLNPAVNDASADPDGDFWSNLYEYQHATDPCVFSDTDSDGMPDAWEIQYAYCGLDPNVPDADQDPDLDTLTNLQEYTAHTNPCFGTDTDGDGLSDADEVNIYGTNPVLADTDGDGAGDGVEVAAGSNPLDPLSYPRLIKPGGDVRVTHDSTSQAAPVLVWTGSEYGVVWEDWRWNIPDYLDCDVYDMENSELAFRRLSAAGTLVGSELRVTAACNYTRLPAMVWTGSVFGISYWDWRDEYGGIPAASVYFSTVSGTGGKLGGDERKSAISHRNSSATPSTFLVWSGSQYGLSWFQCTSESDLYFGCGNSLLTFNGPGGTLTRLNSMLTMNLGYIALAWTGSEFGVSYDYICEKYCEPSVDDTDFVRVTPGGGMSTPVSVGSRTPKNLAWTGSEFGLESGWTLDRISAASERIASVALAQKHSKLIWTGSEYAGVWVSGANIFMDRLNPTGARIGPVMLVVQSSGVPWNPSLVFTGSEFALAWQDTRDGNPEIYFTRLVPDSDGDGLADNVETLTLTSPHDWDSDDDSVADGLEDGDGDGLTNGDEVNVYHTDPGNWDSDGDRLPDGFEAANMGHSGGGLDPMNALDAAADFDGDGNSNANEYWNGSDPWTVDPTPGQFENPGCYYWADADGDGNPAPSDLVMLKLQIAGVAQEYRDILPHGTDTLDLDRDGNAAPSDQVLLKLIVALSEQPGGYPSQALALETVDAPSGSVAVGSTTHVTVSVHSVSGAPAYAPGFGVVFEVVSGNAVLLGGDGTANGEAAGNRYDFSMEAAAGAKANVVVLVTGSGPITIGAKILECGLEPNGRWNSEVLLGSPVVINP
jgi:hypothetical protein